MKEKKVLILHDNHFKISSCDSIGFPTTTFHYLLSSFNGRAHLTSPSLNWDGLVDQYLIDGIVVRPRVGYGRAANFYNNFLWHSYRTLKDLFRLLPSYDAIIIAGPCCSAPFAHFAAWLLGKPIVGYVIGDNREVVAHSKEYKGIKKWLATITAHWEWAAMERIAKNHKVIVLGAELAKSLARYSNNVSLGFTSLIREEQIVLEKKFRQGEPLSILTVGRVSQEKGIEWVLRAIVLLNQKHIGVKYTVVGDGPDLARLLALVSELGISSQVKFTRAKRFDELPVYYQAADIFILPSYTEGVAKVLLEAMAARLPIVATQVGGTPWVLNDGERGVLIPSGDAEAISNAICQYRDDDALRMEKLGNATYFVFQNTMEASASLIMQAVDAEKRKMGLS